MPPGFPLPTLDRLQVQLPKTIDAQTIVKNWFESFSSACSTSNVDTIISLFHPESYWRDTLPLTWDFRTFTGTSEIKQFLDARLALSKLNNFKLKQDSIVFQQVFPDLAWIQLEYTFEVGQDGVGLASAIGRLIPTKSSENDELVEWKALLMYTNLEDLKPFPEKIGPNRDREPMRHGLWASQREKEVAFEDGNEPTVIIIGGGQSGLEVAARLKMLGVSHLIIEKNKRIGDSWRNRYKALCLHDPVWYDHMPYLPFPSSWPEYCPAEKLAGWLESYAESLELNYWTSSSVTKAQLDESTGHWSVAINTSTKERVFKNVKHVIFATGFGSGDVRIPDVKDMDKFKGKILHSTEYYLASEFTGKKVFVIGACTSAHDIAADCCLNGVDVTMYQRSSTYIMTTKNGWDVIMSLYTEDGPPTDVADRMSASFPNNFMRNGISQRQTEAIAERDRSLLEGLKKRGFKTNMGIDGTGFSLLAWSRPGGYYLDVGASQMVVDGKIGLKNDSPISCFTETGLKFENGSTVEADVVIFATGLGDNRHIIRKICGEDVGNRCTPIWGLDSDGEIQGTWRDLGVKGLWYIMGNLALCRFYSKHMALQIKAMEEGVFGERYSISESTQ
ncbi:FAD/NAD(P)-binding domain-containing protein [Dendrothele bispora CBS 962.96]|uniref:FAD/NAD(P)-binding domain-containing protein n=1 Tax=Dendrothele bispora (strain CBS 962.96) TaxID=1314807 RepID=A0A4S8M3N9_DENBC|nr:FAD/NAD(P)-binding domain-containing protein [Dendrothele bispora CBS 962.96]